MKYFTIKELCESSKARSLKIDNTIPKELEKNLVELVENVLDPLREKYGKPIYVNSGYRCEKLNKAVKGAVGSHHLLGEAADLDTRSKEGNKRLFDLIKDNFEYNELINEYDYSWIHVSFRKGQNKKQIKIIK